MSSVRNMKAKPGFHVFLGLYLQEDTTVWSDFRVILNRAGSPKCSVDTYIGN